MLVKRLLRFALAAVFAWVGILKFDEQSLYVNIFEDIGFGTWFRYLTGVMEAGGALLLLNSRTAGVGFIVLGTTMVGAIAFWISRQNPFAAVVPAALLLATAGLGWSDVATLIHRRSTKSQ